MGSIPIGGNVFLLNRVEVRPLKINKEERFSGSRKDSSSRHETTEGSEKHVGAR
jgi:hypothetical protein